MSINKTNINTTTDNILTHCLDDLEELRVATREEIADVILEGDLQEATDTLEDCRILDEFIEKLTEIYNEWVTGTLAVQQPATKKRNKKKRGGIKKKIAKNSAKIGYLTHWDRFAPIILAFMKKHDGGPIAKEVVFQHIKRTVNLNSHDREIVQSTADQELPQQKWTMNANLASQKLAEKKLLKKNHGQWTLTAKGKKAII